MLSDAAEYYALSQFAFAGRPGTKMPDNRDGYDLAVETGTETGKGTGLSCCSQLQPSRPQTEGSVDEGHFLRKAGDETTL